MLKELFESSFYITYPHKENLICLIESKYTKKFTLNDLLACQDCKIYSEGASCCYNINIEAKDSVYCINANDVFKPIKEDIGDCCDYILSDDTRMVLIEMTCSQEKYVRTCKRSKALDQLTNTKCVLLANPCVKSFMDNHTIKYMIFSWKDTTPKYTKDSTEKGFSIFGEIANEAYSPDNVQDIYDDFKFKEIRYPDILCWDKLR